MFTGGGTVAPRYNYHPYGRSTTVLGTTPTDFNFTGLYRYSKSNLDLAVYRAYDPDLGRWLNRDPIAERGGLNLYAYVGNNVTVHIDPPGLQAALPGPAPTPPPTPAPTPHAAWYGNYCGPGGSGNRIDALDTACKNHDDCHAACGAAGAGGVVSGGACVRACDAKLCAGAKAAPCNSVKANVAKATIMESFCSTKDLP